MKHKNISYRSGRLLEHFVEEEQRFFGVEEAQCVFPSAEPGTVRQLLSDMTHRGLLMRVKEGTYHIIPYESDSDTYMPNWHQMVAALATGSHHYIGYYSALQLHNLTVQPSLREQIVVDRQIPSRPKQVKDVQIQFIYHNKSHFFGHKKIWIDSYTQVISSDLEKTIIDCLFIPNYAGGIPEIARAIYMAKNRIDFERLLDYSMRFGSQAVRKRLGYLLELLEIQNPIIETLRQSCSATYASLDPELPKTGRSRSRWKIQENVDIATIQSALYA